MKNLLIGVVMLVSSIASAQSIGRVQSFQPGISGSFYNSEMNGQGINIEYLERFNEAGGDTLVLYLYTYSEIDGAPTWLVCVGDIEKKGDINKNAALLNCFYTDSGMFLAEGNSSTFSWGTAIISATSCHSLSIDFRSKSGDPILPTVSPRPPPKPMSEIGILTNEYAYDVQRLTPMQRSCVEQCHPPEVGPSRCRIDTVD